MFDQDTRNRQVFKQDLLFILIPGYIIGYNKVKIIIHHFKSLILKKSKDRKITFTSLLLVMTCFLIDFCQSFEK